MAGHPLHAVLHHVRRLAHAPAPDATSDSQLLQRFAGTREEAAFRTLLERHAPMVLGLCRRLLPDPHDAEDAFQATFLVMIRKAGSLDMWGSLASWLYGVAYRTALKARSEAARRRLHERQAAEMPRGETNSEPAGSELRHVLDEELSRLPEKYRAPLVLCYLEGKTNEEAARALGWPTGSMSRRLSKGRELLRKRLLRRGVGLSGAAIATAVAESAAPAAVPATLSQATLQAATVFVAGQAVAATPAMMLMEKVLQQMAYSRVKSAVGLLLLVCLVGTGAAVAAKHFWPPSTVEESQEDTADPFADPLPPGAVARLGTSRWWQPERIEFLRFSPNGRFLVTNRRWGLPFRIREVATGKQLPQFEAKERTGFEENTFYDVRDILFSPDSKILAVKAADSDGDPLGIALWDVATGRQVLSFAEWSRRWQQEILFFSGPIPAFAFSSDSKYLTVALNQRWPEEPKVRFVLLDAATGKEVRRMQNPDLKPFESFALSPDGKVLAAGGAEDGIVLLDALTGRTNHHLTSTKMTFGRFSPTFSPDGKTLIAAARMLFPNEDGVIDDVVVEFSVATGAEVRQVKGALPNALYQRSPEGKFEAKIVAEGVLGNFVRSLSLRETTTGREIRRLPCPGEGNPSELARHPLFTFSPDSNTLAAVEEAIEDEEQPDTGSAIQLFDVTTGELLPQHRGVFHDVFHAAFTPDGRPLVVARVGKAVGLWDVATAEELYRFDRSELLDRSAFLFSPDASLLLISEPGSGGIISLKESNVKYRRWNKRAEMAYPDHFLAISADNNTLVSWSIEGMIQTGNAKGVIEIWEVGTGKKLRQFVWTDAKDWNAVTAMSGGIGAAALSPDGRVLALKDKDEVTLWETATGKKLHRIKDNGQCNQFAFSPDGKMLAWFTMGWGFTFHLCEVATGRDVPHILLDRTGHSLLKMRGDRAPRCIVWSPDGRLLATTDDDGTIYLLDAVTGEERGRFCGHRAPLRALAFSPDGARLLSASADRTALVWDVRQGLRTER